jgi:hypothetical protein
MLRQVCYCRFKPGSAIEETDFAVLRHRAKATVLIKVTTAAQIEPVSLSAGDQVPDGNDQFIWFNGFGKM